MDNQLTENAVPGGLAEYGNPVHFYSGGTGIIRYAGGEQHPVGFDAAQYADGRVLILCQYLEHWPNVSSVNEPDSLSGVLSDGTQISAHTLRSTNYLPEIKAEGTYDAFWARSLSAQFAATLDVPAELRYAITNVAFTGMARCTSKRGVYRHGLGLPIDMTVNAETESGVLLPVIEYGKRHRRLITLKAHEVTAEFCIEGAQVNNGRARQCSRRPVHSVVHSTRDEDSVDQPRRMVRRRPLLAANS